MDLELAKWGDGTVRLSFWDSLHGKDRHFILGEGGTAFEAVYDDEGEETAVRQPVNLVIELRKMALENRD